MTRRVPITAGLFASTAYLATPSVPGGTPAMAFVVAVREGVAAIVTYPLAGLFAIGWVFFESAASGFLRLFAAAVATVYVPIYASLVTIRAWHHPLVMPGYLVLGLYTGSLFMATLMIGFDETTTVVVLQPVRRSGCGCEADLLALGRSRKVTPSLTATGLEVSGGSICSRRRQPPSYVMREMGIASPENMLTSFGGFRWQQDLARLCF